MLIKPDDLGQYSLTKMTDLELGSMYLIYN